MAIQPKSRSKTATPVESAYRPPINYYSPYNISIYVGLLRTIKRSFRCRLVPFSELRKRNRFLANFFVRHDIDFKDCIANAPSMLETDIRLGVPSACYLLADGENYDISECRDFVIEFRKHGLEFGLHTSCYIEDDFLAAFRMETEQFSDVLGFRPTSFTVHGLGSYRLEVRLKFLETIHGRMKEFGYVFSDIPTANLRNYSHVIQDCHLDEKYAHYISRDFIQPLRFIKPGANVLVLTHPGHWTSAQR